MDINFEQMQQMLGQAKQQFEALRQKLAQLHVEGTAGGGMVTVRMNGEKQLLEVTLDPAVVRDDPDMLPDLIRAAVNDAGRRVEERLQSEAGGLAGLAGLGNLGGLF
ncbi:MAG: YbaB/EbfC family nucleoid-associated protein [Terriglobales bacterium]